jgi:FSR family fosmidomycin resistance protein-like MFS transporter
MVQVLRNDASVPSTETSATASLRQAAWLGVAHFVVDAVCVASVLRAAPASDAIASIALLFVLSYDLLAFAGQMPLGWLVDRVAPRKGAALAGVLLSALALAVGRQAGLAVIALAGVGNALFHVGAGAMVLSSSQAKAAPAGVFVAPGALGLGLGIVLGRALPRTPLWPLFFAIVGACVAVAAVADTPRKGSPPASEALPAGRVVAILALLFFSVAVRSLVGTVGCDGCPRGTFLLVAVPAVAFSGKLAGGFLSDRLGWTEVSVAALLTSAPLLAFADGQLWIALPGLVIFQMTMPVTLAERCLRTFLAAGAPTARLSSLSSLHPPPRSMSRFGSFSRQHRPHQPPLPHRNPLRPTYAEVFHEIHTPPGPSPFRCLFRRTSSARRRGTA